MKKNRGMVLIFFGLLLLAAALFLAAGNLYDASRAETSARLAVSRLEEYIPATDSAQPSADWPLTEEMEPAGYLLNPDMEMPVQNIDGVDYIGILRIPALELELPVISGWSYGNLRIAPCRYSGSAYSNDLVIAGRNYGGHFGSLSALSPGDTVTFTDMEGNVFTYCVAEEEILQPAQTEQMVSGDWDLTLFTCTVGGRSRVTIRCTQE